MLFRSKLILFTLLLCTCNLPILSQSKINILLDYHYQLGLSERNSYQYHITRKDSKMHGNSLHLTALYNFTEQISAGIGIGADRYESPGYNTFPLFATLHYSPFEKITNLYFYTDLGYAIIDKKTTHTGALWNLGVGYKKMFRPHFGLNFQIGYNLKKIRDIDYYHYIVETEELYHYKRNNTRNSLSFGVGLIF